MTPRDTTVDAYRRHVNAGMARLFQLTHSAIEATAEGSLVTDTGGREYLDCGGYSVFLLGHRHPKVLAAVHAQLDRLPLSTRLLMSDRQAAAAQALADICPPGLDYVVFGSSGAEAVEGALKLARINGCRQVIAMDGAYHGKSLGALSVSGRDTYRTPFQPLLSGVIRVPYGDADAVAAALGAADGRCAVILEPIQSEAGVLIPPAGYLKAVRSHCDAAGALLIVDEISTGLGRVGEFWAAATADDVIPDILICGKPLGGGVMPVSALVATAQVFGEFNRNPLLHSSTFAGNPLACAAVSATIGVLLDEDVPNRARELGAGLLPRLETAVSAAAAGLLPVRVRGAGLLFGVEFPAEHMAADLLLELLDRGVIAAHSLNGHRTLRFTPAVTLTPDQQDWLIHAAAEAVAVVARRYERSPVRS